MVLVQDILNAKEKVIYKINQQDTITNAVTKLNQKKVGALIVEDSNGDIRGIITERDLLSHLNDLKTEQPVKSIMTPAERLIIAHKTDTVDYAMAIFTGKKIRHLPVVEEGKLVGLISIGDTVKALLLEKEAEAIYLQDYISGAALIP